MSKLNEDKERYCDISTAIYSLEKRKREIESELTMKDLFIDVFIAFLILFFIEWVYEVLSSLFFPNGLHPILSIIVYPFIIFLFKAGITVNVLNKYLGYLDRNVSSFNIFFRHVDRNFLIPKMFITFMLTMLVGLISFTPVLYLIGSNLNVKGDLLYEVANILSNNVVKSVVFASMGLFIYNVFMDSVRAFYFNITYNSLIEEFNGLWWNLSGSIKSFFKNKDALIRSMMINFLYSFSMAAFVWFAFQLIFKSADNNALDAISLTRNIRLSLSVFMIFIETVKEVYIDRAIAKLIIKE